MVKVHHITPADKDKNLGKAINDLVRHLPETDWICLRDIDTIPPDHVSFIQICDEIATRGDFDLVGCYANRIGLRLQQAQGKLDDNPNFQYHIDLARDKAGIFGSSVVDLPKTNNPEEYTIAGMMMLFPKWLWTKVGGFPEGAIMIKGQFIDYIFSQKCIKTGARIGLAEGIYLFHTYRWGKDRKNKSHLL